MSFWEEVKKIISESDRVKLNDWPGSDEDEEKLGHAELLGKAGYLPVGLTICFSALSSSDRSSISSFAVSSKNIIAHEFD